MDALVSIFKGPSPGPKDLKNRDQKEIVEKALEADVIEPAEQTPEQRSRRSAKLDSLRRAGALDNGEIRREDSSKYNNRTYDQNGKQTGNHDISLDN